MELQWYQPLHNFDFSKTSSADLNRMLCTLQPFFQAMHRALKPGGIVCTQVGSLKSMLLQACIVQFSDPALGPAVHLYWITMGSMYTLLVQAESLWLHLPIITELATMCNKVFQGGSVQYAYTTIPTYPRYGFIFTSCNFSFIIKYPLLDTWTV